MGIGTPELIILGIIALLLFGKDLPKVAKSVGRTVSEFKKGMSEMTSEFREATRDIEEEAASVKRTLHDAASDVDVAVQQKPKKKKPTPKFVEDDDEIDASIDAIASDNNSPQTDSPDIDSLKTISPEADSVPLDSGAENS